MQDVTRVDVYQFGFRNVFPILLRPGKWHTAEPISDLHRLSTQTAMTEFFC